MRRRTPHIIIAILGSIIALMGVWSVFSVSAQFPIREQFTADLDGWTSSGSAVVWQAAGTSGSYYNPDGDAGSAVWQSAGILESPAVDFGSISVGSGSNYTLHFDWYWTGDPFTVTHGTVVGTGLNCYGSSWPPPFDHFVENKWNSCYLTFSGGLNGTASTRFEATTGALDMVQDFYLIPDPVDGTPAAISGEGDEPLSTPTPVPQYFLVEAPPILPGSLISSGDVGDATCTNRTVTGAWTADFGWGEAYCEFQREVITATSSIIVGSVFDVRTSLAKSGGRNYFRIDATDIWANNSAHVGVENRVCQESFTGHDVPDSFWSEVECTRNYGSSWSNSATFRIGGRGRGEKPNAFSTELITHYWVMYGIPPEPPIEPPIEPPPPSDFGLTCELPTISGTETITATINANLLTNGSFESGLTGWITGTGDYSVQTPATTTVNFASDGSSVLSLPGTGAASICQPWTVPTDTVDHFTGGFDTRSAGDGTGLHNIDLIFSTNITAQIANGFVRPSDTLTWTVNSASQNLPPGTAGQLCVVGDGGDVSAYVDRVYIHARDPLSDVVCIGPSTIITTPTPTPTPSPTPSPTPTPHDGFPAPTIGGDGACYNCIIPTNMLDFGQWIRWLLCGLNNLFYCYLYVWLMSIAGYIAAGLQYAQAFFVWLPTVIQGLSDWLVLSLNGMSTFLIALLTSLSNWLTAGLEAMSGQLVNMLTATSDLLVSIVRDVSGWFTASLQNLFNWLEAVVTGIFAFFHSMKVAIANWVTEVWPTITGYLWGTFLGFMGWIQATVDTLVRWAESAAYWLYSLLAGAINTAVNGVLAMLSSVLAALIAGGAMIGEYAAAAWELVQLYFAMLQQIAAAVVDLLDIIWRMTVGMLSAFTTDGATSVELFGYNIDNMQQPNGINDASLLYWMVLGFMLADAAITSIPLMNVFIYTVMGLMSYGVILWTLRRGTKMLPVS